MTVRQAYETGVQQLVEAGIEINEARLCVRCVIDRYTHLQFSHLLRPDDALSDEADFFLPWDFGELSEGTPLTYVFGEREFFGLSFLCDERALIPRPETELLVENAIQQLRNCASPLIADLGTGSGCVAVSLAHALKESVVYATDLSRDALELARSNAQRHGVANSVEFVEGQSDEWAQPLIREGFAGMFSCVMTNPPYISQSDVEELPPQIKDHEPRMALDGGDDGLDCYRDIACQCGVLLQPDGFLLAELGAGQFDDVHAIFRSEGWNIAPPIHDLAGHERVLCATRAG